MAVASACSAENVLKKDRHSPDQRRKGFIVMNSSESSRSASHMFLPHNHFEFVQCPVATTAWFSTHFCVDLNGHVAAIGRFLFRKKCTFAWNAEIYRKTTANCAHLTHCRPIQNFAIPVLRTDPQIPSNTSTNQQTTTAHFVFGRPKMDTKMLTMLVSCVPFRR